MKIVCAHCRKKSEKRACDINRAQAAGLNIYCDRRCAGLGRRDGKTKAEKVAEKRAYDIAYREKNRPLLKVKRHEYFKRTYDPAQAAVERKKRMPRHVEYCRRPEYRAWKRDYDRRYRAGEFGEFAEAYMLTMDLNREIKGRNTNGQIKYQNGCTNKSQRREREAGQAVTVIRPLTASSLKDILWETLTDLKHENILPNRADAIAAQSREILRTVKIQLQVAGQAKRSVPQEIIEFSERR